MDFTNKIVKCLYQQSLSIFIMWTPYRHLQLHKTPNCNRFWTTLPTIPNGFFIKSLLLLNRPFSAHETKEIRPDQETPHRQEAITRSYFTNPKHHPTVPRVLHHQPQPHPPVLGNHRHELYKLQHQAEDRPAE